MSPEAELWQALRAGDRTITRHSAWLDLFLQLAQPRIDALRSALNERLAQPASPLPFMALTMAEELAGLCAEQTSASLAELAQAISTAVQQASARPDAAAPPEALVQACDELLRQLHQHAAGVKVVNPPHILSALQPRAQA